LIQSSDIICTHTLTYRTIETIHQECREIGRYTDLAAFGYTKPMTLVESMKSGQVKVSWLSDEDIEKKRVSGSTVVCYFTLNLLNSFLSGTDDNTTRARDHPVMM
jgi:hypothetical protein